MRTQSPLSNCTRHAWPSRYVNASFPDHLNITHRTIASVDLDECIARLYKKELLADSVIEAICAKTKELLMKESNVVHIQAPVTVVGDIHGQFFDMIEIFKIGGYCPDTNYLFLGRLLDSLYTHHTRSGQRQLRTVDTDAGYQEITSTAVFLVSKPFLF